MRRSSFLNLLPSDKIKLNEQQQLLYDSLQKIGNYFSKPQLLRTFLKYKYQGLYIYGDVGTGKTMLMKAFYSSLTIPSIFFHYQLLMQQLHLHFQNDLKNEDFSKGVQFFAKRLANKYSIICIDEFYIDNIADAMLVGSLLKWLLNFRVFILFTSNLAPHDLYKNGLKRELFLPYITLIEEKCEVFQLGNIVDYRTIKLSSSKTRIFFGNKEKQKLHHIIRNLSNNFELSPLELKVFGRKIHLKKCYKNQLLLLNFQELCNEQIAYNDFITICKYFLIIVIENVTTIPDDHKDAVIRFINFIDNVYNEKVLLYISTDVKLENIYQKYNELNKPLERTRSRLHEINSAEYFENSKYNSVNF